MKPESLTAQALGRIDERTRAVVPPLHTSTTYERDPDGGFSSGRGYTRPHNPTYDEPEELLAILEGGSDCLLFASGMAAATAVFQVLLPGDHVIAPRVMYWALRKWLVESAMSWGLDVEFVDSTDIDVLAAAVRLGRTRIIWLETPANPTWDVSDIAAAARIAHDVHARLVVDSTVPTPVLTRPLELGADLVVHSASKALNGHGDVLAGAIVCARRDAFWQRVRAWRRDAGAVLGPFEAWLLLRGMRTLFVRVRRSCESALTVARHFENHPLLSHVLYPGLPRHPGHALAARQMHGGFGAMLSIRHANGEAAAIDVAANVNVFKRATSLGGVESLIEHRASIEGPSTPVPLDLLRLSIGLEDPDDLIADLEQALECSRSVAPAPLPASDPVHTGQGADTTTLIESLVTERIRPLIMERGGDVALRGFSDGVATLEITGSPGASVPIRAHIEALIQHHVDATVTLEFVTPPQDSAATPHAQADDTLHARVQRLLDEQINPAVRAHGGHIRLVDVREVTAQLQFEGRCQGCAMADVTLRQGVEVMLKEALPELLVVEDVTDHSLGKNPYFRTHKGDE